MPKRLDLAGHVFHYWHVLRGSRKRGSKTYWWCRCRCGNERAIKTDSLTSGTSRSCGCFRDMRTKECMTKHGRYRTTEYFSWQLAKDRCYNPNNAQFKDYGGRGIRMADEWRVDFPRFLHDMGAKPAGCSLDRINNEGSYEPGNCRWATRAMQNRNSRRNIRIGFDGETSVVTDWAQRLGVSVKTIRGRLTRGWSVERALTTPVRHFASA